MKQKNILITRMLAALALSTSSLTAQATLPDGAVLHFTAGVPSYDTYGNPVDVGGSYFAVDTNGNGKFTGLEKTAMAMHDGIIIGASQPASGSHAGSVDDSESPGIDAPWNFFGNTGMFQTLSPVLDNGDGTLDFSGIGVTWAGIPNIPIGDALRNPTPDTLRATLACANNPCQIGDSYTLDYRGHVPMGDPSGFGGVLFGLHLEGTIVDGVLLPRINVSVVGGTQQECSAEGGSQVTANATVDVPEGDSVAAINWTLDGVSIGNGDQIAQLIPLGAHSLAAEVQTLNGGSATSTRIVTIDDTQGPTVDAAFINRKTGAVVTSVAKDAKFRIRATAVDVCDPNPTVNAIVGAPVSDGGTVAVKVEDGTVKLSVPQMSLSVTAHDASGNAGSDNATLTITQ